MDKLYICIAKCPELDVSETKHCTVTLKQRREREEQYGDYCPCGNEDKWEELKQ